MASHFLFKDHPHHVAVFWWYQSSSGLDLMVFDDKMTLSTPSIQQFEHAQQHDFAIKL